MQEDFEIVLSDSNITPEKLAQSASTLSSSKLKPKKNVTFSDSPLKKKFDIETQSLVQIEQTNESFIQVLRAKYPSIVHNNNLNEDNWYCDICLNTDSFETQIEESEDLNICDLCLIVVHPNCYRKDLYKQDPDDESAWFCQRCELLIKQYENGQPMKEELVPNCMLCPDTHGSVIQIKTKEWVHHTCVNWHNEIWFDDNDVE